MTRAEWHLRRDAAVKNLGVLLSAWVPGQDPSPQLQRALRELLAEVKALLEAQ